MREQQELLWWVVSGYSLTAGCQLRDVPNDAAPCVIARDLARISAAPPGPVAADAFLAHGLRQVSDIELDQTSVATAASATRAAGFARAFPVVPDAIADLLPVLSTLQSGDASDHAPTDGREARVLARQTYNEILLTTYEY
jgi:hypothetical protein